LEEEWTMLKARFSIMLGFFLLATSPTLSQTTAPTSPAPGAAMGGIADWWWLILLVLIAAAVIWYFMRGRNKTRV
jgi:uncharacterized protein HemX